VQVITLTENFLGLPSFHLVNLDAFSMSGFDNLKICLHARYVSPYHRDQQDVMHRQASGCNVVEHRTSECREIMGRCTKVNCQGK
jgi:hypothetical protein